MRQGILCLYIKSEFNVSLIHSPLLIILLANVLCMFNQWMDNVSMNLSLRVLVLMLKKKAQNCSKAYLSFFLFLHHTNPQGYQVNTHCIGDRANRIILDAYEHNLVAILGNDDVKLKHNNYRLRIEHAQILVCISVFNIRLNILKAQDQ